MNIYGQAGNPPANVTKSFNQKISAAQSIKWYKEVNVFKAVFREDGIHYEALYNGNGDWLKTQRTISMSEVHESVKTGLASSKFSSWKLNAVYVLFSGNDYPIPSCRNKWQRYC